MTALRSLHRCGCGGSEWPRLAEMVCFAMLDSRSVLWLLLLLRWWGGARFSFSNLELNRGRGGSAARGFRAGGRSPSSSDELLVTA